MVLRHLLPAPAFTQSAFAVPPGVSPAGYMGVYAPAAVACSKTQFEQYECSTAASGHPRPRHRTRLSH